MKSNIKNVILVISGIVIVLFMAIYILNRNGVIKPKEISYSEKNNITYDTSSNIINSNIESNINDDSKDEQLTKLLPEMTEDREVDDQLYRAAAFIKVVNYLEEVLEDSQKNIKSTVIISEDDIITEKNTKQKIKNNIEHTSTRFIVIIKLGYSDGEMYEGYIINVDSDKLTDIIKAEKDSSSFKYCFDGGTIKLNSDAGIKYRKMFDGASEIVTWKFAMTNADICKHINNELNYVKWKGQQLNPALSFE